jgi:hypothetical protein
VVVVVLVLAVVAGRTVVAEPLTVVRMPTEPLAGAL